MFTVTIHDLQGKNIKQHLVLVSGEVILSANAVIAVNLDYENISNGNHTNMLMISGRGTEVVVE